jgi:hypothetical protein
VTPLHELITGKSATAVQAFAVVVFVIIEFSLVIIPFAFPGIVARSHQGTPTAHPGVADEPRQLIASVAVFVGAYMVITGLARLLT